MGDDADIAPHAQPGLRDGPPHADGRDHRGDQKGRRGRGLRQHAARTLIAVMLGHLVAAHPGGVGRDSAFGHGAFEPRAPAHGEIHRFEAVDQRDAPVAQVDQQFGRALKGAAVVHVDPGIGDGPRARAPVHDKGQTQVAQQRDAGFAGAGAVQHHAIDPAARGKAAIGLFFLVVGDDGQDHFIARARIAFARACDEIGKDRVHHLVLGRDGNDMADGHRPARRQPPRGGRGAIVELARGILDPSARGLADLGIAVERAADRGLRQPQGLRQFFEVHHGIPLFKALSILDAKRNQGAMSNAL